MLFCFQIILISFIRFSSRNPADLDDLAAHLNHLAAPSRESINGGQAEGGGGGGGRQLVEDEEEEEEEEEGAGLSFSFTFKMFFDRMKIKNRQTGQLGTCRVKRDKVPQSREIEINV